MQDQNAKLLAIYNKLFDIHDLESFADFVVNDSHKVLPYQLAVLYEYNAERAKDLNILSISGALKDTVHRDFNYWLKNLLITLIQEKKTGDEKKSITVIHEAELASHEWADNLGKELLLARLYHKKDYHLNLILINPIPYTDDQIISFNILHKAYQQSLKTIFRDKSTIKKNKLNLGQVLKISIAIFILAMFIPVTPSVMAPAEIISERTWAINAPVAGRINKIAVEPNAHVEQNQILFEFDQLDLLNNFKVKQQELNILTTEYNQSRALGFDDKEQRAKIFRINQDITAKQQEVQYAQEQLNLSIVTSPAAGTVLFKSRDDLLGKPTDIGETIMRLANVKSKETEIWLDINDSINLTNATELYYYSNKDPFYAVPLTLTYFSYEAYITPNKKIAYRLLAKINQKNENLIIGDHGQAKIYGTHRVLMAQFLFQKPLATLRKWFYRTI